MEQCALRSPQELPTRETAKKVCCRENDVTLQEEDQEALRRTVWVGFTAVPMVL